ncbi:unnamed protein product [Clonostachys rhizophaga]|uniref:Uncharacterized protein n=1 Tax=Clonostachys rhizophaga TaxID=160324 RepID=A0A9N9VRI8_9HYPO|nr:unnamed protein product [Clonostachys rhizophaga]
MGHKEEDEHVLSNIPRDSISRRSGFAQPVSQILEDEKMLGSTTSPHMSSSTPDFSYRSKVSSGTKYHELGFSNDDGYQTPTKNDSLLTTDVQPHHSVASRQRRGAVYHLKCWIPEIIWSVLTIGLLAAIVAVLSHFNGKPMPQFSLDLTLNTLLAFLTTICRTMTIIPLAEAISQLKWNWFASHPRPLHDMYHFDQASRGPWGSFLLLIKARGRFISFAWVAALVFLSGLFTTFLTQSTITYKKDCASDFDDFQVQANQIGYGMARSAYQAAIYTVNESWPVPQPNCSEVKCNWSSYSSLGMCASITNVTDQLNMTTTWAQPSSEDPSVNITAYNITLPKNLGYLRWKDVDDSIQLNMTTPRKDPYGIVTDQDSPLENRWTSLGDWNNTDILSATVAQSFYIYSNTNPDRSQKFRAIEILYHFCVYNYESEFINGTSTTKTLSSTVQIDQMNFPGYKYGQNYTSFRMKDADGDAAFNVTVTYAHSLLALGLGFSGAYTLGDFTGGNGIYGENMGRNFFNDMSKSSSDAEIDEKTWRNAQKLTNNVADGMTAFMRNGDNHEMVNDTAYKEETFVRVRWEWLSFLVVQIALTIIFPRCGHDTNGNPGYGYRQKFKHGRTIRTSRARNRKGSYTQWGEFTGREVPI